MEWGIINKTILNKSTIIVINTQYQKTGKMSLNFSANEKANGTVLFCDVSCYT